MLTPKGHLIRWPFFLIVHDHVIDVETKGRGAKQNLVLS
jgi:hypothetical protein